jgi:hypothetical protein
LDALATGLEGIRRLSDHSTTEWEQWHDYAFNLGARFRHAMEKGNPGLKLGTSNDGPVARFVAAAIPYVSGEMPAVAAVARHLQREEARSRRQLQTRLHSGASGLA